MTVSYTHLDVYKRQIQSVSVVVITLIMSYFSLVFGELVPKRVAMQKAEAISFGVIGVLRADGTLDEPRMAELIALAGGCGITLHLSLIHI